jgi:hypothetical protein
LIFANANRGHELHEKGRKNADGGWQKLGSLVSWWFKNLCPSVFIRGFNGRVHFLPRMGARRIDHEGHGGHGEILFMDFMFFMVSSWKAESGNLKPET